MGKTKQQIVVSPWNESYRHKVEPDKLDIKEYTLHSFSCITYKTTLKQLYVVRSQNSHHP